MPIIFSFMVKTCLLKLIFQIETGTEIVKANEEIAV